MNEQLCFDDVLIIPRFSKIASRRDVNPGTYLLGMNLSIPVISSNMDTVTGPELARALGRYGAVSALHRFQSIEDNVSQFKSSTVSYNGDARAPIVSVGLGTEELSRAEVLIQNGAQVICLDVAHGATQAVVDQAEELRKMLGSSGQLMVGNFATADSINAFRKAGTRMNIADAYKVGIGGGSACLTRVVTGVGLPTLASVQDCAQTGMHIVADGGIRNSGDMCKALAAGAKAVMVGRLFAGSDEAPGTVTEYISSPTGINKWKNYRGSASAESYVHQGKTASWRAPEGASYRIPCTGPVLDTLRTLEGGLRSSMSYVNATNLVEYREYAQFSRISVAAIRESGAHGKL